MIDFDKIKALPVSEELIAAYLDGKLDSTASTLVEANLLDSPGHADFVETLKEFWNLPETYMEDFGTSEMDSSEMLMVDNMNLPSVDTDDMQSGFNAFDMSSDDEFSAAPAGSEVDMWQDMTDGIPDDENYDIFSQDTDIFSSDNQSLDIDTSDGIDDLSEN